MYYQSEHNTSIVDYNAASSPHNLTMMTSFEMNGSVPLTAKQKLMERKEKDQQFQFLLTKVKQTNLNEKLAVRNHRASVYEKNPDQMSSEYQKKVKLQNRLKRGRRMNQEHFRTEQDRLDAYERERTFSQQPRLDYEKALVNHPTRLNYSTVLSQDRTFPACVSSVKAPVEMESHLELIKQRVLPNGANRKKTLSQKQPRNKS